MHLHGGGGRVVAQARQGTGGQANGTGCHHDLAARPVHYVPRGMVESPLARLLTSRLRRPSRRSPTPLAAVDVPPVVALADVEDLCAPGAANPHEDPDNFHASAATTALTKLALPVRPLAPSPGQRPRATRRLRAAIPGPSAFAVETIDYETQPQRASFRRMTRGAKFSGSSRPLTARSRSRTNRGW